MTLNQVIQRVQTLALSHRQINHFFIGGIDEFLDNEDVQYPAIFCEIKQGQISKENKNITYNFTFYFLDLMGISSEAKHNEWEVKSDMSGVAQDYIAMLHANEYSSFWAPVESSSMDFHTFKLHDLCAGVSIDIGLKIRNATDRCQVPASGVSFEPDQNNSDMIIQNYIYAGTGNEGAA